MDEKIEKVIALAGNQNRYQYFTLIVIVFLWINCNFISIIIPFIEREPLINYKDNDGEIHTNVTLTHEICEEYEGKYEIVERFNYSWVSEFGIECKKFEVSLVGSFVFIGNTAGGVIFSVINKLISHKKILIISSFIFCISAFLNTLITSFDYFYGALTCLIFLGAFGNCLCYSSLVIAEEIVSSDKRSLFSSIINVGYALCGVLYSLAFYFVQDWRIVYYILIGASLFALFLIWAFIYDSPRGYINKKDFKNTIRILEGIAAFNGKLEEFKESLKQDEFQDIISAIKGEEDVAVKKEDLELNVKKENEKIKDDEDKKDNIDNENNNDNESNNDNDNDNDNDNENIIAIKIEKKNEEEEEEKEEEKEENKEEDENEKNDVDKENNILYEKRTQSEALIQKSGRKSKIQDINICSLFKYKSVRYKFLILNMLWVGTRAVFNGIAISSKSFPGNFYFNIIILYIVESIACALTGITIDIKKLGRKGNLWIMYFLITGALLLLAFIDLDETIELALNFLSRFCAAGIDVVYYTYSIEIYPTLVRSVAFGVNATFGNGGSIIAPLLLEYLDYWLFLFVFAIVCFINSILLFFLPETVGKPMIETIKELGD